MSTPSDPALAIEQIRAALPWWVSWGAPLAVLGTILVLNVLYGRAVTFMFRRALRRTASDHWTERARQTWVWRAQLSTAFLFVPVVVSVIAVKEMGPLAGLPAPQMSVLAVAAAWVGTMFGLDLHTPLSRRRTKGLRNRFRIIAFAHLLSGLTLPLLLLSFLFTSSDPSSPMAWLPTAVTLALFVGLARGGASWILRGLKIMRPANSDLDARIRAVCEQRGVKLRGSYTASFPSVNAMALIQTQEVVLVGGFEELLDGEEFDAVIAHEAGHLSESPGTVWSRIMLGTAGMLLPLSLPLLSAFGVKAVLLAGLAVFAVSRWGARLSRRLETRADEHAEGAALARGLEKVHAENLLPAVLKKNTTHPSLVSRMRLAGIEPSWPIPAAPSMWRGLPLMLVVIVVIITALRSWENQQAKSRAEQDGRVPSAQTFAALTAGGHPTLLYLGNAWYWEGREALAEQAFAAAFEERPRAWTAARVARMLEQHDAPSTDEWRRRALELAEGWSAADMRQLMEWMDS